MLFYLGGMLYTGLELLWRGRSHSSMFVLGGACFLTLGQLRKLRLPWAVRMLLGSLIVTVLELGTGLAVNRQFLVWDYRRVPLNFRGQICLPFSLLWMPICLVGMLLYGWLDARLTFGKNSLQ